MSALENETTAETTTFEALGRTWTLPTRRHLSHLKRISDELRAGYKSQSLVLAEVFLDEEQFEALLEIDPDEEQLTIFAGDIAKHMGYGDAGN